MQFKNLSIKQLVLWVTLIVSIINLCFLLSIDLITNDLSLGLKLVVLILPSFLLTYFVVRSLLEYVIFRKIKLLYKIISSSRKSIPDGRNQNFIINSSLESVGEEVEEWAQETQKEISTLKSLEEYRKNFVGDVSHELKTPLFSIQGYLHTLLEGGLYDEKINLRYIKRALKNTERLQSIVDDLDMIQQLERENGYIEKEDFDLKSLIEEIFLDVELMAKEKEISIHLKEGANKSFIVNADRKNIRTAISNLIINSIKYGKQNGTTKVGFYEMDDLVLVEISDNGLGIDDAHLKHLFDRFYRVDSSRSREQGGSGLGLSIVKHILEAHNQRINVRSTVDVGSTFSFTLKRAN